MIRLFALAVLAVLVVVVGQAFGWKYVLAPLLGWAFISWALASLRSMAAGGAPAVQEGDTEPRSAVAGRERTMYWCEECGTEFLLVTRGSGVVPRHCGVKMHERVEVLGGPAEPGADDAPLAAPTLPRRERG